MTDAAAGPTPAYLTAAQPAEHFLRRAGRHNDLTDVTGLRVGHHQRLDGGFMTGCTVVLAPPEGMTAGVDVRGGAPGTRETDLLHPTGTVQKVHALVLTGGSAYGLATASGVADALGRSGIGLPVPGGTVPIVPAAVLFDLGRGGVFQARPDAEFGELAVAAAEADVLDHRLGSIGAGAGAVTCGLKSGLGMASAVLPDGTTVAALVVCNAVGSPVDATGVLLGARLLLPDDTTGLGTPTGPELEQLMPVLTAAGPEARLMAAAASAGIVDPADPADPAEPAGADRPGTPGAPSAIQNTTLVIVATDARLTKSQCTKFAMVAHDGLARALDPVHTALDGDTVFAVSTGSGPAPDDLDWHRLLAAGAAVVTRALVRGLLAAEPVDTPAGSWPSYSSLVPSAVLR